MKFAAHAKLLVVCLVCVSTWILCEPLRTSRRVIATPLATVRDRAVAPPQIIATKAVATNRVKVDAAQAVEEVSPGPGMSDISLSMSHFEMIDGRLAITAEARIHEGEPGYVYLWVLQTTNAKGQIVATQHYAHQMFTVPQLKWTRPTFTDVIDPPADGFFVHVLIARMLQGHDLEFLKEWLPPTGVSVAGQRAQMPLR